MTDSHGEIQTDEGIRDDLRRCVASDALAREHEERSGAAHAVATEIRHHAEDALERAKEPVEQMEREKGAG